METNKFETMLQRNTHRITLVLFYAILEWILIFLLLLNSLLYFLISKFANYFGLKPPCTFCSGFDHLFDPNNKNIYKDLICEEHVYEISQNHQKPILESNGEENKESVFSETKDEENQLYADKNDEPRIYDQDCNLSAEVVADEVEEKSTNEVLNKMEISELVSSIIMAMQGLVNVATEETQSPHINCNIMKEDAMKERSEIQEGEEGDCRSSDGETEFEFFKGMVSSSPRGQLNRSFQEQDKIGTSNSSDISIANNTNQELNEVEEQKFPEKQLSFENGELETWKCCDGNIFIGKELDNDGMTIEELKMELKAKQEALSALYTELEEERNAAAVAASQTMTMMTRLQQEKAAMQMEARQYQRMMEEQSEYDQEALQLLNDLMVKKEKEKLELEKELEIYRKRVLDYETQGQVTMIREDDDDTSTDTELDFEEMRIDPAENLRLINESLGEFEAERLSILEELKGLEMKLVTLANDEELPLEDINPSGYHTEYPQYEYNFGLVNSKENAMIVEPESKKILPFYDENETTNKEHIESSSSNKIKCLDLKFKMVNKRVTIEEEMGHVYERLQGLEADRDLLKHCIGSLSEGDEGIDLLREILQHLRDLRTVEVRARSLCDSPLS